MLWLNSAKVPPVDWPETSPSTQNTSSCEICFLADGLRQLGRGHDGLGEWQVTHGLPRPSFIHPTETVASALIGCGASFVISHSSKGTPHVSTPPPKHKDKRTNGVKAAIQNNPRFREAPHRWDRPYNSRCLIKDCDSPVYHDGATYFSLCLLHLEELRMGPFFKPHNEKADDYD
mgnify:CR=1 FL=1